jgi:two-component system chemotaxis response regulator CheB
MNRKDFKAVVIGVSLGGMEALKSIFESLPKRFPVPIIVVQHLSPHSNSYLAKYLDECCDILVKEAEEKEKVVAGTAYIAPPNYHLLIEKDETLSLSVEPKVNFARPSIDILFESAADTYGEKLIGIILTGANHDGSVGLKCIKKLGGLAIVQNPETAYMNLMPKSAINETEVDFILNLEEIAQKLIDVIGDNNDKK